MQCLFIDAENFQPGGKKTKKSKDSKSLKYQPKSLVDIFTKYISSSKRLYGDFSKEYTTNYWDENTIVTFGLDPIHTNTIIGKGSVDAHLMLDVLELTLTNDHIETVIICGNDKDYIPLCNKLRLMGIKIIIYGCGYSNICKYCDEYYQIDKDVMYNKKELLLKKDTDIEYESGSGSDSGSSCESDCKASVADEEESDTKQIKYFKEYQEYNSDSDSSELKFKYRKKANKSDLKKCLKKIKQIYRINCKGVKILSLRSLKKYIRDMDSNCKDGFLIKNFIKIGKIDKSLMNTFPGRFKMDRIKIVNGKRRRLRGLKLIDS